MSEGNENIKKLMFAILVLVLLIPWLQKKTLFFKEKELNGTISKVENIKFEWQKWFEGDYQKNKEVYYEQEFGFRKTLIRFHNQIGFNFFGEAYANGVIIGKDGYLFEENYITSYFGADYIGEGPIKARLKKFKYLQDTLSAIGKQVIIVLAPGKASFFDEYIPDSYSGDRSKTNYLVYKKLCPELKINYIDFRDYFVEIKEKSKYPLFPKCGIHWSEYGSCLVTDSILGYLNKMAGYKFASFNYKKNIELSEDLRYTDYDIGDGMNLLFKIPNPQMAYPKISIGDTSGTSKPHLLVIGDSFFWNIFNHNINPSIFSNIDFWYYNKESYSTMGSSKKEINPTNDIPASINKSNVILIECTESNLSGLGWDFIEQAYDFFKKSSNYITEHKRIDEIKKEVLSTPKWKALIEKKAKEQKIPFEEMLKKDIEWQMQNSENPTGSNDENEDLSKTERFNKLTKEALNTPAWKSSIEKKAKDQKISFEEMLKKDIEWMIEMENKKKRK